jgi:hypothetical protein
MDDGHHHRLAAFELVQPGQQRGPVLAIELAQDIL